MRLIIMTAIYAAQCIFAAWLFDLCLRKWRLTAGSERKFRVAGLVVYAALSLLPVAGAFLPDSSIKHALQAAGNVWLGFYLYFGFFVLALLMAAWVVKAVSRGKLARQWHGGILCLSLVAALSVWGYGLVHAQRTAVVTHEVFVDREADEPGAEMKIVLIGDLHLSVNSKLSTTERMVGLINAEDPDLVLIAGDVFTSSYAGLAHPERYIEALKGIQARDGVYAVYGNHDVEETLLGGFPVSPVSQAFRSAEMEAFFDDSGFITLMDEMVVLPNGVQLAGRIDLEKTGDGTRNHATPEELLKGADRGRPILVLEHEPREYKALGEAGANVVFSGHTHAGQMFPGELIIPLFNENVRGYAQLHGVDTIVTSGVGTYGPPMRVGTDSEITVINLKFK